MTYIKIEKQGEIDLLLNLHKIFRDNPLRGSRLNLSYCSIENVVIKDFDFDGVSCEGAYFENVNFINIKNPPWRTYQSAIYQLCAGIMS